jgi:hypothetical protein
MAAAPGRTSARAPDSNMAATQINTSQIASDAYEDLAGATTAEE